MKIDFNCNRRNFTIAAAVFMTGLTLYLLKSHGDMGNVKSLKDLSEPLNLKSPPNVSSLTKLPEPTLVKREQPWWPVESLYRNEWVATPEYRRIELEFWLDPATAELLPTVPNDQLAALQEAFWERARLEGTYDLFEKVFIEEKLNVIDIDVKDMETWSSWVAKHANHNQQRWDAFDKKDTEAFHKFLRGRWGPDAESIIFPSVPRGKLSHPFGSESFFLRDKLVPPYDAQGPWPLGEANQSFVEAMVQKAQIRVPELSLIPLRHWRKIAQKNLSDRVAQLAPESLNIYNKSLKSLSEASPVKQVLPWKQVEDLYHKEWVLTPEYRRMEIGFWIDPPTTSWLSKVPDDQLAALQEVLWERARIQGRYDVFKKIFLEHKFKVLNADAKTWNSWVTMNKGEQWQYWDGFLNLDEFRKQDTKAFHKFLRSKLGPEYASYKLPPVPHGKMNHPFSDESFFLGDNKQLLISYPRDTRHLPIVPPVPRGELSHPFGSDSFAHRMLRAAQHCSHEKAVLVFLEGSKKLALQNLSKRVKGLESWARSVYELAGLN